jgi:hypothetical protein
VNPVLKVTDGTLDGTRTLTISSPANDSGALTIDYAPGVPISVDVTAASCGLRAIIPAAANVVVQYHAR